MANRQEYLRGLAGDYGMDQDVVEMMADILGESEDYDGLITELDDLEDLFD